MLLWARMGNNKYKKNCVAWQPLSRWWPSQDLGFFSALKSALRVVPGEGTGDATKTQTKFAPPPFSENLVAIFLPISCSKALFNFKGPKSVTEIFGLKMTPPLKLFQKFIRLGGNPIPKVHLQYPTLALEVASLHQFVAQGTQYPMLDSLCAGHMVPFDVVHQVFCTFG